MLIKKVYLKNYEIKLLKIEVNQIWEYTLTISLSDRG